MKTQYPFPNLIQLKNEPEYGSLYFFKPWAERNSLLENKQNIIVIFGKHHRYTPDSRIYGGGYSYLLKPEKTYMKLSVKNADDKEMKLKYFLKEKNIKFLNNFGYEIIEINEKQIKPILEEFIEKMNDDNYFEQLKIKFGITSRTFFCKELINYLLNNHFKKKINKLNTDFNENNFNDNYLINDKIINNVINDFNNIINENDNDDIHNKKFHYYSTIIKRVVENYFRVLIIFYKFDIEKFKNDSRKDYIIENISKNFKINKNTLTTFLNDLNIIIYNNDIQILIKKTMEKFINYTTNNNNDNIIQRFYMDTLCPNQVTRHETAEVNTDPSLVNEKYQKIINYDNNFFNNFNLDKDYVTDLTAGTGIYLITVFNILNEIYSVIILNKKERVNKIASQLLYGDINPVSAMIYKVIMIKYGVDEEILDNNILIGNTTDKKLINKFFGDKIKNTILWPQNPPYNGGNIYYNYIKLANEYVKDGGYICMISPYAFLSSSEKSSKILDIFTENKVIYHNIDKCAKWFPGIGSSFNYYIIKKETSNNNFETIVETDNGIIKKKYSKIKNFKINGCYFIPKTYFKNYDNNNIDIQITKKLINYKNTNNKLEKYMNQNSIIVSCINKVSTSKKTNYYLWTSRSKKNIWDFNDINDEHFKFLLQYISVNDKNKFNNNKCIEKPKNKGKGIILNINNKQYEKIKNDIFPYIFYNTNAQNRIMHCNKKYDNFDNDKILICRCGNPHPTRSKNSNFNGDVRAIINNNLDYYEILLKETNILKNYLKKIYDTGNAFIDIKVFYNIKTLDNITYKPSLSTGVYGSYKYPKITKDEITKQIYNHYGLNDDEIKRINNI